MVSVSKILKRLMPTTVIEKRVPMSSKQKGSSGTEIYAGYYAEEYIAMIRGLRGARLYDEMRRSDSQVAMLLSVVKNPIKSAKWDIEPADDSDEARDVADFIKHVLFKDIRNPKTGKRKAFSDFIEESLTCIEFGYSVFEVVHRMVRGHDEYGDYIGLRDLGFRSQKTIEQWGLKSDGALDFVRQRANGDTAVEAIMAGENVLVFSLNKEGDNYEGVSMIRPCYGNWLRKNAYLKSMAIGIEKTALGVPVAIMSKEFLASDDYEDQFGELEELMSQFVAHENSYLILPAGVELGDYNISFDAEKVQKAIDKEDVKMTKRFLANFLELGMGAGGSGGSYSLGSDLSDVFLSGITYIADDLCEKVNMHVIEKIIDAKYGKAKDYPKLVCRGINDKAGKELSEILSTLIDKGVVKASDRLVDFVHDRYGLPPADHEASEDKDKDEKPDPEPEPKKDPEPDPVEDNDDEDDIEPPESPELDETADRATVDLEALTEAAMLSCVTRFKPKGTGTLIEAAQKQALFNNVTKITQLSENLLHAKPISRADLVTLSNMSMLDDRYKPEIKDDKGQNDEPTLRYAMHGGAVAVKAAEMALARVDAHVDNAILSDPKIAKVRASVFIDREARDLEQRMKERLLDRSDDMLAKIDRILRSDESENVKSSKVLKVTLPRAKQYRDFLSDTMGSVGQRTQAATLQEVGKADMKLDEADFKGLPKKSRDRIKKEIGLVAHYQDADFEKMVYFTVNDELSKQTPVAKIIDVIKKSRGRYIAGGVIFTAATNLMSKVVNGVRNDVFQVPEVMNDIESFILVNHDPKSAICKNLVGRVFSKEEYESSEYLPPLHHNCKTVIAAQTAGAKGNKPIDPKGLMPSGTDEELDKILKSKTL